MSNESSETTSHASSDGGHPTVIGEYRIVGVLGTGGMGTVYAAEQQQPHRTVALKVIRSDNTSEDNVRRFVRESEVLGRLQHAGIAQIYAAGTACGKTFFAMELVRGRPLNEYLQAETRDVAHRLEVFARICDAVHYAHKRGVIHRDLKPANILVDDAGQPKIVDFGVARLTESDNPASLKTEIGVVLGTLQYMSPEQVVGDTLDVDTRSDIYALGLILYEMLSEQLPYALKALGIAHAAHVINTTEPPPLGSINKRFRGDIETIVAKAIEKEKSRRYSSVAGMANDVRRHLRYEPIEARPASAVYQMQKLARKHRALFAGLAIAIVAVLGGTVVSIAMTMRARVAQLLADSRGAEVIAAGDSAKRALALAEFRGALQIDTAGGPATKIAWLASVMRGDPENASARTAALHLISNIRPPVLVLEAKGPMLGIEFSPDGQRLVTSSMDSTAQVWDARTGAKIGPALRHLGPVASVEFSSDGRNVLTASFDGSAQVWNAATGERIGPVLRHPGALWRAAFSKDGNQILTASTDGSVQLWQVGRDVPLGPALRAASRGLRDAAFSPDGKRIVTASTDGTAQVWDVGTRKRLGPVLRHLGAVASARFSADGRRILTASADGTAQLWDAATGDRLGLTLRHTREIRSAVFSTDERRIVTASWDSTAQVWDAKTGKKIGPPLRYLDRAFGAALSPDGLRVSSALNDGTATVLDNLPNDDAEPVARHSEVIYTAVYSTDGLHIVTGSLDSTAQVWDAGTRQRIGRVMRHAGAVYSAAFSPDGDLVVTASTDGTAQVWHSQTGEKAGVTLRHANRVKSAAFSPDGRYLVTASEDSTAQVWDARTGAKQGPALRHLHSVMSAVFSPDGKRVLTGSFDRTAQVWDAVSGSKIGPALRHEYWVSSAEFSPDGRRVLTGSLDATVQLWDAHSGAKLGAVLRGAGAPSFAPDGQRIVTAMDSLVQVWDAQTGLQLGVGFTSSSHSSGASFSADGQRIISTYFDGAARAWHTWTARAQDARDLAEFAEAIARARLDKKSHAVVQITPELASSRTREFRARAERTRGTKPDPQSLDAFLQWYFGIPSSVK